MDNSTRGPLNQLNNSFDPLPQSQLISEFKEAINSQVMAKSGMKDGRKYIQIQANGSNVWLTFTTDKSSASTAQQINHYMDNLLSLYDFNYDELQLIHSYLHNELTDNLYYSVKDEMSSQSSFKPIKLLKSKVLNLADSVMSSSKQEASQLEQAKAKIEQMANSFGRFKTGASEKEFNVSDSVDQARHPKETYTYTHDKRVNAKNYSRYTTEMLSHKLETLLQAVKDHPSSDSLQTLLHLYLETQFKKDRVIDNKIKMLVETTFFDLINDIEAKIQSKTNPIKPEEGLDIFKKNFNSFLQERIKLQEKNREEADQDFKSNTGQYQWESALMLFSGINSIDPHNEKLSELTKILEQRDQLIKEREELENTHATDQLQQLAKKENKLEKQFDQTIRAAYELILEKNKKGQLSRNIKTNEPLNAKRTAVEKLSENLNQLLRERHTKSHPQLLTVKQIYDEETESFKPNPNGSTIAEAGQEIINYAEEIFNNDHHPLTQCLDIFFKQSASTGSATQSPSNLVSNQEPERSSLKGGRAAARKLSQNSQTTVKPDKTDSPDNKP